MPTDLNILKKAFANVAATYETVKPWDEPFTRRPTVEPGQTLSVPSIPGDVGGWVTSGGFPYATVANAAGDVDVVQTGVVAPSRRYFETNPGRAGYNDVDFVPYNWGTNRFGNKGGALLGHPISWEVVGPTSKSPFTHWQWFLDFTNNQLILEAGVATALIPGALVPTVQDGYGLDPAGLSAYNGGLYVLVTLAQNLTGLLAGGRSPSVPKPAYTNIYQYELFRVEGWAGQNLILEAAKPLSTYFTEPGINNSAIRAITLIRPKVTRLAAMPLYDTGTSQQRNQVYVVMPPEKSAATEFMPPYIGGGACPDWSVNGGFDVTGTIPVGVGTDYGTKSNLPVPLPVTTFKAFLTAVLPSASEWEIQSPSTVASLAVGQVVRVRVVKSGTLTVENQSQCLGYFEVSKVVAGPPDDVTLKRVPEVNPTTGEVFYGPGPTGGLGDELEVDLFENLSTVFTDPVLNIRKVLASRIDHIIAPKNVEGSYQGLFTSQSVRGVSPSGPAIFDTTTDSDPGNLTNLGFRMVLFPAKADGGGNVVPDFDNPIPTDARVVLDPSNTAPQYIEVDYDAGVIYLSVPPVPGAGCAVAPNGIIPDPVSNPRNEVVLYAACVPYSREPSQRGAGVQVKTMRAGGELGDQDAVDLYGQRLVCDPTVGMIGALTSTLVIEPPSEPPSFTGWFLLGELNSSGTFTTMSAPMYYSLYDRAISTFFGVAYTPYAITANTRVLILKGSPFEVKYNSDGVRGSSKRTPALNFRATRTSVGTDGTLTISPVATLDDAYRANDPSLPALGRTVTVNGKAIEAQPDNTAGDDTIGASFRVDTRSASDASVLTGFDFAGKTSSTLVDPYAGFIDRRVLSSTSGLSVFTVSPTCTLAGATVTLPGGQFWWTNVGGSKRSYLVPFLDLIEIDGKTYVISGFGATNDKITVVELDLVTVPVLSGSTKVTAFRPKFFTGRGNTGNPFANVNSWFMGQQIGANPLLEPFGALNLYAGSSSSVGLGDGGGALAALSFWSRVATAAGAGDEALLSTSYFDTMGRLVSTLNPDFMQGGALPDYTYRGDFATRRVMGTYSPAIPAATPATRVQPTLGHIVEEYNYLLYRYDNLSMFPLLPDLLAASGGAEYAGQSTANTSVNGEVFFPVALNLPWIPFGACVVEVTAVAGNPARYGLYRVYSGTGNFLYIRHLDGTSPTATEFPPGSAPEAITIRLHYTNQVGKLFSDPYLDAGTSPTTHTPTQIVGVSVENDAVGMVFAGPDRLDPVLALSADRHAYRVTAQSVSGGPVTPSNDEKASLDLGGFHKANDYLYNLPVPQITKQINQISFHGLDASGNPAWAFNPLGSQWVAQGHFNPLYIPLVLPRSSDRLNTAGNRTHRTQLATLTIMGEFFNNSGVAGNRAFVTIHKVQTTPGTPPTRLDSLLYISQPPLVPPYTQISYLPVVAGGDSYYINVFADALGTPEYVDDTANYTYYAVIVSNNGGGGPAFHDIVYGAQVTYTDPGPRNY